MRDAVQLNRESSCMSQLLKNCEKLCLTLPLGGMPSALNPVEQVAFTKITRLELTPLLLNSTGVANIKLMIGSCPNLVHFKLHVLQFEEQTKLYHLNMVLEDLFHKCLKVRSLAIKTQQSNL